MDTTATFIRSAESFRALLGAVQPDQWELPGLGNWTVRSLAGHTARAILTVETYLMSEAPSAVTVPTAEAYYVAPVKPAASTDAAAVEARGVDAGLRLGSDPVAVVSEVLSRTRELLESQPSDRIVGVVGGLALPLHEYLRTRVFELTVHSIDLSRATGIPSGLPSEALTSTLALASSIAIARDQGEELLLALCGRLTLPVGFSVV